MKNILKIQKQISLINLDTNKVVSKLEIKAKKSFEQHMDTKQNEVKALINKVENSKDIYLSQFDGWPIQYTNINHELVQNLGLDLKNDFITNLLKGYFDDLGYNLNTKDFTLELNCGPAILINEDNDVLDQDSGKWIIAASECKNKKDLFAQIEAYMEKSGCFPSVIKSDHYDNAYYVDTKAE